MLQTASTSDQDSRWDVDCSKGHKKGENKTKQFDKMAAKDKVCHEDEKAEWSCESSPGEEEAKSAPD